MKKADLTKTQQVLIETLTIELRRAQDDYLLAFPDDPDAPTERNLQLTARRIALKLTEGRDEYRSGRRGFDRLRDVLWSAWSWRK